MASSNTVDSEQIFKDLETFGTDLERLRNAYEQYFLGLDRLEPNKLRESVKGFIRKYSGMPIQNTRLKFRFQQLIARYNTFCVYWDRVLKEIEEGRYQRDVFKAKLHQTGRSPVPIPTSPVADPMARLFDQYVAARKKCGETVANLSIEKFKATIKTQVAALEKKTGSADIRFSVVTENGKTKIRAIPKKKLSS